MKFSIVIPHITKKQEHLDMLMECVSSFEKYHPNHGCEVIIVDDCSVGEYPEFLKKFCESVGYVYLSNDVNSGFPRTANKGIAASSGDVVLLVNNDIVFTQPVLDHFKKSFEVDDKVGIVGSLLFYPDGTIQHAGVVRVGPGAFVHRGLGMRLVDTKGFQKKEYLSVVTGALFAVNKKMISQIGAFNAEYFLAFDDVELCYRAWDGGWRVYYNPDIRAIHKEGATRGRTEQQKIVHHREWYLKEMQTHKIFQNDMKKYDDSLIDSRVSASNYELLGLRKIEKKGSENLLFKNGLTNVESKKYLFKREGAFGDVLLTTPVVDLFSKINPNSEIYFETKYPLALFGNDKIKKVINNSDGLGFDKIFDLNFAYENSPKENIVHAYSRKVFGRVESDLSNYIYLTGDEVSLKKFFDVKKDYVVFHPAKAWECRTWPKFCWDELATRVLKLGKEIVVIGAGLDFRLSDQEGVHNLQNVLTIPAIKSLIDYSKCFVGMDSGMLHVAQATKTPIVGLFTVANPEYRLLKRQEKTVAVVPKLECRFCLHDQPAPVTYVSCKYGTNHCLQEITPEAVEKALLEVL